MEPEKTPAREPVPEFKGFGSIKRSSTSSSRSSTQGGADSSVVSAPSTSASNLARSGTLSWQQRPRPGSKLGGPRPMSMASVEGGSTHTRNASRDEPEPSRDQIAASLGARDPSWFKQTAERGIGNAAYRKNKDEAVPGETSLLGRRGLPGMSRESSTEPEIQTSPPTSASTEAVSRDGSTRQSVLSDNSSRYSATSSLSTKPDLKSLIAADEDQQRASPSFDRSSTASADSGSITRTLTMSSSQARLAGAADRSASPTKGMGGFVQSAMMKRSDSQNKRWSAQHSTSISRGNSVASSRAGFGGLQGSYSMPKLDPTPSSRETSNDPPSRPIGSNDDLGDLAPSVEQDKDVFVKPAIPHHSRSKSVASNYSANEDGGVQSPGSPSKRFSPNKSSWIESALTKPDSPKPAPSKNSQPSWMVDLAKAKAQRGSTDLTSSADAVNSGEDNESRPPSRPGSPMKNTPFGPALLKRAESRAGSTANEPSKADDAVVPRPKSPTKGASFGQDFLKRSESRDQSGTPQPPTPSHRLGPLRMADNFTSSPAASPKAENPGAPEAKEAKETSDIKQSVAKPTDVGDHLGKGPAKAAKPMPPSIADNQTSSADKPSVSETTTVRPSRSQTLKSSSSISEAKPSPESPPKAPTDFRSQLKSRPRAETQSKEEPEFLSKFGNLRKTQQEKYVAPDVLKDNILRGKSELAITGGPVKTERKDELKESLLAKKDDWKKAKEEGRELPGQLHERKISGVPQAPTKPEALAQKELLGRSDSIKVVQQTERTREGTPEALARHKSLKQRPVTESKPRQDKAPATAEAKFEPLSKQASAPGLVETNGMKATSKLAARFNPGLAGMLARGPPSNTPSRPGTPGTPGQASSLPEVNSSEPPPAGTPLQDMRRDRAKGPKRRKGGAKSEAPSTAEPESIRDSKAQASSSVAMPKPLSVSHSSIVAGSPNQSSTLGSRFDSRGEQPPQTETPKAKPSALPGSAASVKVASLNKSSRPLSSGPYTQEPEPGKPEVKKKPQALPGSAASLMNASLSKSPQPEKDFIQEHKPSTPSNPNFSRPGVVDLQQKLATASKSPSVQPTDSPRASEPVTENSVPVFKGFAASRAQRAEQTEDKENAGSALQSVKLATSQWARRPSPPKNEVPAQIQLPNKRDEEAAMRSAGLLASKPKNGLGISTDKTSDKSAVTPTASAGLPPKPVKSSRTVSGQLAEASPNKGSSSAADSVQTDAGRLLAKMFGVVPKFTMPLAIDTPAVLSSNGLLVEQENIKTLRKSIEVISSDGSTRRLQSHEEYTLFDESVHLCTHVYLDAKATKNANTFVWTGYAAAEAALEAANVAARQPSREHGSTIQVVRQGLEPACFLRALGGILITRRGSRDTASKQYMLCGRKHLGHIVFDEVDFAVDSLCAGYVFLISHPVTLQEAKLYLWKGQACSAEELSAARLAAMDLSETGEIIEVDGGVEFPSFLKVFGPKTTKWNITKPSALWQQKALAPDKFKARLYRIQQAHMKTGLLSSLWNRRPSWNSISPARSPERDQEGVKVAAKEISPFTQSQLEVEGVYLLDAYGELYVLLGPLLSSLAEHVRDALLAQALLFASEYAIMAASTEDRPTIPKCSVIFSGIPRDVKMLFRQWEDRRGLWGTGGLMAGSAMTSGREVQLVPLDEVLTEVCK